MKISGQVLTFSERILSKTIRKFSESWGNSCSITGYSER